MYTPAQLRELLKDNPAALKVVVDICDALTDFTDGESAHDLVPQLGVSLERAEEIKSIGDYALKLSSNGEQLWSV